MGWVTAIYWIIKFGIELWPLISEVLKMIQQRPKAEQPILFKSLENAASRAKKEGDRRPLRGFRDNLQKICFGPNCPVDPA